MAADVVDGLQGGVVQRLTCNGAVLDLPKDEAVRNHQCSEAGNLARAIHSSTSPGGRGGLYSVHSGAHERRQRWAAGRDGYSHGACRDSATSRAGIRSSGPMKPGKAAGSAGVSPAHHARLGTLARPTANRSGYTASACSPNTECRPREWSAARQLTHADGSVQGQPSYCACGDSDVAAQDAISHCGGACETTVYVWKPAEQAYVLSGDGRGRRPLRSTLRHA
ncbi:hypothetical protein OPT61_g10004 [Boeremia exigua]|uniref:Uncharacterized protein n=1 Tax=Boeremia exigua TaxID=749465 RepID=A0ACC2HSK2_9PLEO|nr:hypothetical protein OPT61_g10004 [Boeremia exigua]